MPLRECVLAFDPPLRDEAIKAAKALAYRDFLTVALMVRRENLFPDNWIYVHDPTVKLGRIQNFNNWSASLLPESGITCLGLEYFCFKGDGLWEMSDTDLITLGKTEIEKLGLVKAEDVFDGAVVRMEKAYPIYDPGYQEAVEKIRIALSELKNFQVTGRNGMHKYNNQDHSMMTALLAARNIDGGSYDIWKVNTDAEYHEGEVKRDSGRQVPQPVH
jgi:protoporphyrinogen oxidase